MSLRICYLAVYVFAMIVSAMIKTIGAEVAKDPHRLSDYFARTRETTLSSWLAVSSWSVANPLPVKLIEAPSLSPGKVTAFTFGN